MNKNNKLSLADRQRYNEILELLEDADIEDVIWDLVVEISNLQEQIRVLSK